MAPGDVDNEPRYESQRYGMKEPIVGAGEPEFEDEPPGSYLGGLSLGMGIVVWSVALDVAVVVLALIAAPLRDWARVSTGLGIIVRPNLAAVHEAYPGWVLPLATLWRLAPVVALSGLLIALFIRMNHRPASAGAHRFATASVVLQLAACFGWVTAAWGFGVGFRPF